MSEETVGGRVDRIVGRLRDIPRRNLLIGDLVHEAADEIERLRAENERLRASLTNATSNHERFEREWYLRGDALERIRDMERAPWDLMVYDMQGIAAEALTPNAALSRQAADKAS